MNVRALLMANLCFKLFLVGLCLLLVRVHYMFSDSFAWFRPAASEREVTDALERESADVNARNKDGLTGLILAAGNSSGAWLGTHLGLSKGAGWIRTVLLVAILIAAARLLFWP